MPLIRFKLRLLLSLIVVLTIAGPLNAQSEKKLRLVPQAADSNKPFFRLLPTEDEQEPGNAVPVLLRITYEQTTFMANDFLRLHEYAEMDVSDPRLAELQFDSFARQIIRAGSMSYAEWEYPLYSDKPYSILLPDMQSQRQLAGRGMSGWIRQRLAAGEVTEALQGIRAQIACGRHCAAAPVIVCQLVGAALAHMGLENLELAIQRADVPNMYWSLAALPPTLQDLGPVVRWELWASPMRLDEPLPAIGSDAWIEIANEFSEMASEWKDQQYTLEEAAKLKSTLERLAKHDLLGKLGFTADEILKMSTEERIMRWLYMHYCNFRARVEPLAYQDPKSVMAAMLEVEATDKALLKSTGAKQSPLPIVLPKGIVANHNFGRRVKYLQTIEAIRDHLSQHDGAFPESLEVLELPAPNDPFTGEPFEYELTETGARLRQAAIEGWAGPPLNYALFNNKSTFD